MGFLSDEKTQELFEKLEDGVGFGIPDSSETADVNPPVEAASVAEEKVEGVAEAPEVPGADVVASTEAGKSEEQDETRASDGDAEEESVPSGHRVPYKRFKDVLNARNQYKSEADEARAQMEAHLQQMELMRSEVSALRNLRPATPVEDKAESVDDELDRLLNGQTELPRAVRDQIATMERRLHQQEVEVERNRLRREVADVVGSHDERLHKDIQQVLYSAVQRDPNVDMGRVAEQYVAWLAQREEEAISRYLTDNPDASVQEAAENATEAATGVPSRPKRAGTGASRVASSADSPGYKTITEGSEALLKAFKKGGINLFG